MFDICRKRDGGAMVAVLMVAVLLNITLAIVYFTVNSSVKKSGERRSGSVSLNSAEAAKERLYAMIRAGSFKPLKGQKVNVFTDLSFGKGTISVSCSTDVTGDTLYIQASGTERGKAKKVEIVGVLAAPIDFPVPSVQGAITSRNHLRISGNIRVDGRDFDSVWTNAIPLGAGLFGVSTCSTLTIQGNTHVGGMGIAPYKGTLNVSQEFAEVTDIYNSPESFLGVAPGSLDSYRVGSLPPAPFHGLYYLSSEVVGPLHLDEFSSGIIIVSSANRNAEIRINTGTFKGIIIVDKIAKLAGDAQILGAVVTLSDGQVEFDTNSEVQGAGTAQVRYSSRVLSNLAKYCDNLNRDVKELSWKEVQ